MKKLSLIARAGPTLAFIVMGTLVASCKKKSADPIAGSYMGTLTTWTNKMDTAHEMHTDSTYSQSYLEVSIGTNHCLTITAPFLSDMPQTSFDKTNDNHYRCSKAGSHYADAYDIYLYPAEKRAYVVITNYDQGLGDGSFFNGNKFLDE